MGYIIWTDKGELVNLEIEDVRLSERLRSIVIWGDDAKGGKQREVPVPIWISIRPAKAVFSQATWPAKEGAVGRIVSKCAIWARLEGVTPHILRHTFSYSYLEKTNNDLIRLPSILGHDNVTTTQIYTQKPLSVLQEEIEKVQFF